MNAEPYHNEPGYEKENPRFSGTEASGSSVAKDVSDYSAVIRYETLRVAVVEMLKTNSYDASEMPQALKEIMISHFTTNYEFYENLIQSNQQNDGQPIRDPYGGPRPSKFEYQEMSAKLFELRVKFSQNCVGASDVSTYDEIAKKALMANHRDVLKPEVETSQDLDMLESSQEADGSALYVSESEDGEEGEKCSEEVDDSAL